MFPVIGLLTVGLRHVLLSACRADWYWFMKRPFRTCRTGFLVVLTESFCKLGKAVLYDRKCAVEIYSWFFNQRDRYFKPIQALFHSTGMNTIWVIYRFPASCDFFVRVFCSTPKNKWEFADRLCFGGKYARNKKFVQNTEHQRLMYGGCFPAVQKAPYGHAIWPISGAEMHHITPWYGRNRTLKQAWSERKMNHSGPHCWVYEKTVRDERVLIICDLTFLYISFVILFCQNKVKKIYKFVVRVFFKNADIEADGKHGKSVQS